MTTHARPAPPASAVLLALLAVYLIWGSTYLAIRLTIEGGYPPLLMAGVRFVLAGAAMYAVLRARGVAAPTRVQWRHMAVLGLLLMGLGNGLVTIAVGCSMGTWPPSSASRSSSPSHIDSSSRPSRSHRFL